MCIPLLVHGRISYRVSTRLQEWKWECRNVAMHDFANSRGGRVKVKLEYVIEGSILFFFRCDDEVEFVREKLNCD